jgi:hypothetical protein
MEGASRPTARYDHAAVIFLSSVRTAVCPALKVA